LPALLRMRALPFSCVTIGSFCRPRGAELWRLPGPMAPSLPPRVEAGCVYDCLSSRGMASLLSRVCVRVWPHARTKVHREKMSLSDTSSGTSMKRLLAATFFAATLAQGAALPYDEAADAHAQVAQAVSAAAQDHRPVLVVFGANWCPDCRALDIAMKDGRNAELIGREFRVVKVDVGRFDRNVDVAERYGVPLKKGIPAVAIVAPDGHALYATKAGELADACGMSEDGLYRFFREAADRTRR